MVFGPTRNPLAPGRTSGGSSGGSAAAIAAGMVPLCTGSDGGGSIRIPSAVCGISGFKVTHGVVPGGDANAPTWGPFSTRGPMARTFPEIAYALDVVQGLSARDLLSFDRSIRLHVIEIGLGRVGIRIEQQEPGVKVGFG